MNVFKHGCFRDMYINFIKHTHKNIASSGFNYNYLSFIQLEQLEHLIIFQL